MERLMCSEEEEEGILQIQPIIPIAGPPQSGLPVWVLGLCDLRQVFNLSEPPFFPLLR